MVTIYFNLINGYLDGYSITGNGYKYSLEIPEDHEVLKNPDVFKYVDGKLVKDEEKQQKLIEEEEKANTKPSAENMNALAILELAEKFEKLKEEK